jgi:NADP-dependent 3-hydroxy acid dehydrogenase YdfG
VLTVASDVIDPQNAERIVGATIDRLGRIDTLVNYAGIFVFRPFVEYAEAATRAKQSGD